MTRIDGLLPRIPLEGRPERHAEREADPLPGIEAEPTPMTSLECADRGLCEADPGTEL